MKYLLDTHTFLWWHDQPNCLSPIVLEICQDTDNKLFLSMISVWEIQIKLQLNKLTLNTPLVKMLALQQLNGIHIMPIEVSHILELQNLPLFHKDPFDRLIIAQSRVENAILLSKDEQFQSYPVTVIW
jgi:PIN domain nuclease of toxin-antitoxin system